MTTAIHIVDETKNTNTVHFFGFSKAKMAAAIASLRQDIDGEDYTAFQLLVYVQFHALSQGR